MNEIQAKTILRRPKQIDSWFISKAHMNLYRGCVHACAYCDGRDDTYGVQGEFGKDIAVKTNALEILKRELDPSRKRKPFRPAFIMLGGGVGDSYQQAEEKYELSRGALKLIREFGHPVHILTKSTLVERDLDIIREINNETRAIVSFSFSTVDPVFGNIFEPGVPSAEERLRVMARFKAQGIAVGMFLMPVIPFLTDTPDQINASLKAAKQAGADFVIFSGMTLKDGVQKDHFMDILEKHYPERLPEYVSIYRHADRGETTHEYYQYLHEVFLAAVRDNRLPIRIPQRIWDDRLYINDKVRVILDQIGYLLQVRGVAHNPYGYAAYKVSEETDSLYDVRQRGIHGIGPEIAKVIKEILDTGSSRKHRQLLA